MIIRKATENDISQVAAIYDEIITAEESSGADSYTHLDVYKRQAV